MKKLDATCLADLRSLQTDEDADFFVRLLKVFLSTTDEKLSNIERAISLKDFAKIASESHSLKSSCLNIGALTMAPLCKELEHIGKSARHEDLQRIYSALCAEWPSVKKEILSLPEMQCSKD